MRFIGTITLFSVVFLVAAYGEDARTTRWDFSNLDAWRDDSQGESPRSYAITDGVLRLSTRRQSRDRVKVRTADRFGAGRYTWRLYVPQMGRGDQASIGAFLYQDDQHEVDFEIGYGKASLRRKLKARETDLVCYCTCQGHPYSSSQILIERQAWHTVSIDIGYGEDGDYLIRWFVDGKPVKQLQTSFGNETTFTIHCSVENLLFIGDHLPTQENYALFDHVEFAAAQETGPPSAAFWASKNRFFAFDNGVGRGQWSITQQADVLKELGYAGIGYTGTTDLPERLRVFKSRGLKVFSLYVPCDPDREEAYSPQLVEAMKQLEGTGAMLWLTVPGKTTDPRAVHVLRELADAARPHGVKIALYPHFGCYVATARDALRLAKLTDRKNLGISINLCHELRSGNAAQLGQIVKESVPYLFLVSINGADHEGGWDRLIQTLDRGTFDMRPFLRQLQGVGYTGPIGLQCYNVKGDIRENLQRSMKAWNELSGLLDPQ